MLKLVVTEGLGVQGGKAEGKARQAVDEFIAAPLMRPSPASTREKSAGCASRSVLQQKARSWRHCVSSNVQVWKYSVFSVSQSGELWCPSR